MDKESDGWELRCTIECFLIDSFDIVKYSIRDDIDPADFTPGSFEPFAYMDRDTIHDAWIANVTDEIAAVEAAEEHIAEYGQSHIPFIVMKRDRDGFEMPVRVKKREGVSS